MREWEEISPSSPLVTVIDIAAAYFPLDVGWVLSALPTQVYNNWDSAKVRDLVNLRLKKRNRIE